MKTTMDLLNEVLEKAKKLDEKISTTVSGERHE